MIATLFKTAVANGSNNWFLETKLWDGGHTVTINVYECDELEWADTHAAGSTHQLGEWDGESDWKPEYTMNTPLYFSVVIAAKYWFPKFNNDREDFSYQWYNIADAEALMLLLKECARVAKERFNIDLPKSY